MASRDVSITSIPNDGVSFSLTLEPTDELEMVRSDGYDPTGWAYTGTRATRPETRRVKLVRLGYVRNLAGAQSKAMEHGYELVPGQWREAFKCRFPFNNGSPIAFGGKDSAWRDQEGTPGFPVLGGDELLWRSGFARAIDSIRKCWRWLVFDNVC